MITSYYGYERGQTVRSLVPRAENGVTLPYGSRITVLCFPLKVQSYPSDDCTPKGSEYRRMLCGKTHDGQIVRLLLSQITR